MTTLRQNKVSRLVQKELGEIFQREGNTLFTGKMITVTNVRITPDLGQARVYLSVFPSVGEEDFNRILHENGGHIRHELGNRIRNQLRLVPELQYFLDDSLDYLDNIERLLKK
jgi:ribosome-binding factor A